MIGQGFILLASVFAQAPADDPLALARSGQLQCYTPNAAQKTCRALAGYRQDGEAQYINRAQLPITPDGSMTLTTTSRVRIVSGAVCGTIQAEDIAGAELAVAGSAMDADRAAPLLTQIAQALTSIIGHEICTRYVQNGDGLVAEGSMDGTRRPDLDQPVIWVGPSDGYRVSQ